jgi:phosphohistidine swiveling domain-containing protein
MESLSMLKNADDVGSLIKSLVGSDDMTRVLNSLVRAVIYIRTGYHLKGSRTESVPDLELSIKNLLENYGGAEFEEIYPVIRELVRLIPKFQIFGIDIAELRDIAHDFDAKYRYDDKFRSIASDIRKLTHQNLSDRVITKIDAFEQFLKSDKKSAIVDGSVIVDADSKSKDELLRSEFFLSLVDLKEKLKIAWNSNSNQGDRAYLQDQFIRIVNQILKDLSSEEISEMPDYLQFLDYFVESMDDLRAFDLENISIGRIRYYLKKIIEQAIKGQTRNKGAILFRLITVDTLLEQVAFIYYSNVVNSVTTTINHENYFDTLKVLFELALCSRAVGHGTKHLGRFAFLLDNILRQMPERPDRAAHFPTIVNAMNAELEKNFFYLQDLYFKNIEAETLGRKFQLGNNILNDLIREKTTHLLGNIINNLKTYYEEIKKEAFTKVLESFDRKSDFQIDDFIYHFGTDINPETGLKLSPEFMGGKGYSLATSSKIILENGLENIGVPKGSGFSTLTWHQIKGRADRISDFRSGLADVIRNIEKRSGKRFGDSRNPLLLMARSGGVMSLPGILDTISHIGLNMDITASWSSSIEEPIRAYHAYINFILSYAESVLGLNPDRFIKYSGTLSYKELYSYKLDQLKDYAGTLLKKIQSIIDSKNAIPEEPFEQIYASSIAVFQSFENELVHRQAMSYGIPEQFRTSCIIQECLPILSSDDCSGVLFTRNPATGKTAHKYQEHIEFRDGYFGNAIVEGMIKPSLTEEFIESHQAQYEVLKKFKYFDEREQRYPTDIEFAVRNSTVYIVQSRILQQSPAAQIMNSYDFYKEGIYSPFKLIKRTAFSFNKEIIETYIDSKEVKNAPVIACGRPVNGGAVSGRLVKDHKNIGKFDDKIIYITESNVPPSIIMQEKTISGYISREGGITSHAAIVAISEHKPCVTDVKWSAGDREDEIILGGTSLREGDCITLDANTGNIYLDEVPIIESDVIDEDYLVVRKKILEVIDELVPEGSFRN